MLPATAAAAVGRRRAVLAATRLVHIEALVLEITTT